MQFSVALAPSVRAVAQAVEAERLGYAGVWVFDSPALTQDVWIHLGLVSRATEQVRLGPAVLVPSLRHVINRLGRPGDTRDVPGRIRAVSPLGDPDPGRSGRATRSSGGA